MTTLLKVAQAGYNNKVFFKNVPYYTQFSPTSIANCALWLDGADASTITTATGVSQWNDKSGNGFNLTQDTGSLQPTRTGNYLNFQSNYFLNIPTSAINNTSAYSFFFVFNPIASLNWILQKQYNGVGSYDMISMTNYWQTSTGSTSYLYWTAWANPGPFANSGSALSLSTVQLIEITFDGTTLTMYRNGNVLSTSVGSYTIPNATSVTNCTLGSWIADGSIQNNNTTNFQLGEFVYYNTFLSTTQRQKIESYLAQKWGLVSSLPAGHLNATFPAGSPEIIKNYISHVQINVTNILYFISIMSTVYSLSTYSLANIANAISAASSSVVYIWTVAVPSGAKGKNGLLVLFFNLYSLTAFSAAQYFDYGIYVDDTAQLLGDTTGTIRYVQTASGNYAMSSGGISLGTNGLGNGFPLVVPISFGSGASLIQIGLKNSLSALYTVSSTGLGYVTNVLTSSGTINTSNYIPQNTFTTVGASTYTVPTNTSAGVPVGVYIYCWGAGGCQAGGIYAGGSGGFVSGYYQCSPGTALYVVVGSIGSTAPSSGGGGTANQGNASNLLGGGFSGVFINGAAVQANTICVAGGGGGAQNVANGGGGGGGYPAGGNGGGGTGGSQTVQGSPYSSAGANGAPAGTALLAASTYGNGAGGGGYWGGGCGNSGGGGGGSSYYGGLTGSAYANGGTILGSSTPSANVPGGSTNTFYQSGKGVGNAVQNTTGTGLVVIIPAVGTNPCQIGVSAKLYSV